MKISNIAIGTIPYIKDGAKKPVSGWAPSGLTSYASNTTGRVTADLSFVEMTIDSTDLTSIINSNYLTCTITVGLSATDYKMWIEHVVILADDDSTGKVTVRISTTVDYWAMYWGTAYSGLVGLRSECGSLDRMMMPEKYYEDLDSWTVKINSRVHWLCLVGVIQTTLNTENLRLWFPFYIDDWAINGTHITYTEGETTYEFANMYQILNGLIDEYGELDPSVIKSAFISPIPPFSFSMSGDEISIGSDAGSMIVANGKAGFYDQDNQSYIYDFTLPTQSDTQGIVIKTPLGTHKAEMKEYTEGHMYVDVSGLGGVLCIWLGEDSEKGRYEAGLRGALWEDECVLITLSDNSLSAYVYSGQAQADTDARNLANKQALYSGLANSATSAGIGGAFSAGSGAGAGAGAILGSAGSAISSLVNYGISSYFGPAIDANKRASAQAGVDAILQVGGNVDKYVITALETKQLSVTTINMVYTAVSAILNNFPCHPDTAKSASGWMKYTIVTALGGDIPPQAYVYIVTALMGGVLVI